MSSPFMLRKWKFSHWKEHYARPIVDGVDVGAKQSSKLAVVIHGMHTGSISSLTYNIFAEG